MITAMSVLHNIKKAESKVKIQKTTFLKKNKRESKVTKVFLLLPVIVVWERCVDTSSKWENFPLFTSCLFANMVLPPSAKSRESRFISRSPHFPKTLKYLVMAQTQTPPEVKVLVVFA